VDVSVNDGIGIKGKVDGKERGYGDGGGVGLL